MASVQLANVRKVYPDGHIAIHDLDLVVDDGDFCVLVGPSGCGKSTVLRMVAGLESVTAGDIFMDDERVNESTPQQRDVAMTFQNNTLYPKMTVAENLGFSLRMAGEHRRHVARRVDEVAHLLHVEDILESSPGKLSGGQRQRVALGRSIIRSPRLFLMDEPLSNLDARLRIESRAEILRIHRRCHTTTMFVTHDQVEAMAMADQITVMRDGHVVQSASPGEIYSRPIDMFVAEFMGTPAMTIVAGIITTDGHDVALRIGSHTARFDDADRRRSFLHANSGRPVGVGIRPEFVRREGCSDLVGSVEHTESLGAEQVVHVSIDAPSVTHTAAGPVVAAEHRSLLTVIVDAHEPVSIWQPFAMALDTEAVHLFDLETGASLPA